MDFVSQIIIILFGGLAIWFVGRTEQWKKWGYIFGLCSQPFWLYTTIVHKQWGLLALSCWYTFSWTQGVWNYWIKPNKEHTFQLIPSFIHPLKNNVHFLRFFYGLRKLYTLNKNNILHKPRYLLQSNPGRIGQKEALCKKHIFFMQENLGDKSKHFITQIDFYR